MERIKRLQELLKNKEIDIAIIHQPLEIFYFTGNFVQGFLTIPSEGEPVLFVKRPKERELVKPFRVEYINGFRDFKQFFEKFSPCRIIGIEADITPTGLAERFKTLSPDCELRDISFEIRYIRMKKDPEEIEKIKKAAGIIDTLFEKAKDILKEGITERDLMIELEYQSKKLGNLGIYRMRNRDNETSFAHILSGKNTLLPSYLDAATGGAGISDAFPQGPSNKKIVAGEPIGIDIMINYDGYIADATRTFFLGKAPQEYREIFDKVMEIFSFLKSNLIPGKTPDEIARKTFELARKLGVVEIFMGRGKDRVRFIGHGVGLEVDEFPFIIEKFKIPLEANTIVAVEPKIMHPSWGMAGIENTFLITEECPVSLVKFDEGLIEL